jgi:hypothetical protein
MNKLKLGLSAIAFFVAGIASGSVYYTNDTDTAQTVTIFEQQHYSYYGFDNWDSSGYFTQTVNPGDTLAYDDYYTTEGDGGTYSETYDLVDVTPAE